ncbi:MAG: hypothetical protein K2H09_01620, partial [Treponemataceae bacterium]|nr:hypothetical protein [Treponemataceae bacterium]
MICSDRGNLSEVTEIVRSTFADSSVSESLIDSLDFSQMGESLSATTNCIVVADCVSNAGCLEFACGFLCGRDVPVYVVGTGGSAMPPSVPALRRFSGISALSDFLLQNKKQIAADSSRRTAFK